MNFLNCDIQCLKNQSIPLDVGGTNWSNLVLIAKQGQYQYKAE